MKKVPHLALKTRPLRALIMGLVLFLVGLAWIAASRDLIHWFTVYSLAKETIQVNREVDTLLHSGLNLAFERGRTNVLLSAAGKPESGDLSFIAERRTAVTRQLEPVLQTLTADDDPLMPFVRGSYGELKAARKEVDRALALEKKNRDPALVASWFPLASRLIQDIGELATSLSLSNEQFSISFRSMSRMKILAFDLRVSLGSEASRIAAAVSSGKSMAIPEMEQTAWLRGESTATWNYLKKEARIFSDPVIDGALSVVDRKFFQDFRVIQNLALDSLLSGQSSAVTVKKLTDASVPALDSIASLLSVLTQETEEHTAEYLSATRRSLALSSLLSFLSLCTGLMVIFTVVYRLFIPLHTIGEQLNRLAEGDLSCEIVPVGHRDEVTRSYASVIAFRESLIERQKLEVRLLRLSLIDGLTGLANRRNLDSTLEAEWQRAARSSEPLAAVMFDVDHFKLFNDHYGHLSGDECLKQIAEILKVHARRPADLAARFGGEEFMAVLPGLNLAQAVAWADAARVDIEALKIPHSRSDFGVVTISAGVVSVLPSREGSVLTLVRLADEALYRAKAAGRNRVES